MDTLNVSLPDDLQAFVDEQVANGSFATGADFLRALIQKEWDRQRVRDLLLEGAASPPAGPADDAYFDGLRERISGYARKSA